MQSITDFRETGAYKHARLVDPGDLTDEQLVRRILAKSNNNLLCTLQDARILDVFESETDPRIHVPLGADNSLYDGIYDIWLRDCNNVATISVVFTHNNIEIPITEYKRHGNSIQIPLAFMPELARDGVKHIFNKTESCLFLRKRLSYIPSVTIQFDKMYIKLNPGASCKVHLSTVYHEQPYRREMVCSSNIFYVNGVPLITKSGTVERYIEKENNTSTSGCIIS